MKYVISLGGSIINPGIIDTDFLKEFKKLISKSKHEFIIVCGGGKPARDYIKAGQELGVRGARLDEIGIRATELNAELVSSVLGVKRAQSIKEALKGTVVTNGLFPGVTTDFDSVVLASMTNAKAVINLSNVNGVYDKDPREHGDAQLLKKLSYEKLIELASHYELGLGAHFVFDLAASKLTARDKIKVVFIKELKDLKKFLKKQRFTGSIVE